MWWYAALDGKVGPISTEELKQLLELGKIEQFTMVWKEGWNRWCPVYEVQELEVSGKSAPPPLPKNMSSNLLAVPKATSWPRFFARTFDLWWEVVFVAITFSVLLAIVLPNVFNSID